jgi:heptosyltransferase-3
MIDSFVRRVLIYRLGSIGDTVVALPSLHLIARSFPNAERRVLTNYPVNGKAAPMAEVLGASDLVHGYMRYTIGTRNLNELRKLRAQIVDWAPNILIYLAQPRGYLKIMRDALFFYICGIHRIIGLPIFSSYQRVRQIEGNRMYESQAHRLARCLKTLGSVDLRKPENWDLRLSIEELKEAGRLLHRWAGAGLFITASIGTKSELKDWGGENWGLLLERISNNFQNLGLALVGSSDEFKSSEYVAKNWKGPKKNFCGTVSPRISAAIIKKSITFMGHDSGPMHLAAATNVPCIAIFSGINKPGEWYPIGKEHTVIYNQTDCFGCGLTQCSEQQRKCIKSITVDDVLPTALAKLKDAIMQ